jgi:hypothetical protein
VLRTGDRAVVVSIRWDQCVYSPAYSHASLSSDIAIRIRQASRVSLRRGQTGKNFRRQYSISTIGTDHFIDYTIDIP